jgi:hypothetical protein
MDPLAIDVKDRVSTDPDDERSLPRPPFAGIGRDVREAGPTEATTDGPLQDPTNLDQG